MEERNIYLRPITTDDTDDVIRWRNSDNVKKYFIYQGDFTREGHLRWLEEKVNTGDVIQFMIIEKESDRAVGSVYLRDVDRDNGKAEYGIFIGEDDSRGKGYGTQAARLMLAYAFGEAGLHRIYLRAFADNERAIASYKKVGFSVEGILRDDVCIRGEYRDIAWMAAINPYQ